MSVVLPSTAPVAQDFVFNLLTAKFDEQHGVWAYKLPDMLRVYLRGWFAVDLVSGTLVRQPLSRSFVSVHRPLSLMFAWSAPFPWQLSILPFDIVGYSLNQSAVSQLKALRIVRMLRLMKLVRVAKASRFALSSARAHSVSLPVRRNTV